jgi:hypothetical protein
MDSPVSQAFSELAAFVFDKAQIVVGLSPLSVDFDDMKNPNKLVVEEKMACGLIQDGALAKVKFKPSS